MADIKGNPTWHEKQKWFTTTQAARRMGVADEAEAVALLEKYHVRNGDRQTTQLIRSGPNRGNYVVNRVREPSSVEAVATIARIQAGRVIETKG